MSWSDKRFCYNCGDETSVTQYIRCIEGEIKKWYGCSKCSAPYTDLFKEHYYKRKKILELQKLREAKNETQK